MKSGDMKQPERIYKDRSTKMTSFDVNQYVHNPSMIKKLNKEKEESQLEVKNLKEQLEDARRVINELQHERDEIWTRLLAVEASYANLFEGRKYVSNKLGSPSNLPSSSTTVEYDLVASTIRIRIIQEPLTPHNLATIISELAELFTKYWLIAKRRFVNLIEYTQTHDVLFVEEARLTISKVTYNSPFSMDWKIDLSAPSLAEAIVTTIDGIKQRKARLEKAELENQAQAQELKQSEQKSGQEQQFSALELEKQALKIERQRLALLEKRLEVQKKGIEYALEIAKKTVDVLQPNADSETKAMIIQTILPNILQLQNGKGLELALPEPKNNEEEAPTKDQQQ